MPDTRPRAANSRRLPTWLLPACTVVAAGVWSVVRSGPNVVADLQVIFAAANAFPDRLDNPLAAFYTDSPLLLLLVRGSGVEPDGGYYRLMLLLTMVGLCLLALWAALSTGGQQTWRAARLALLAPLTGVLVTWIGFYDPLTVLAWALALWVWWLGRGWVLLLAGALLGIQHFEHALLGSVALLLTWHAVRGSLPTRLAAVSPLWLIPGLLVGKGLLTLGFALAGTEVSGRSGWLSEFLREWTVTAVNSGPILLWSLFAGSWALVVAGWLSSPTRRARLLLVGALSAGLVGLLLSGDRPRVFVLVMAPSLALLTVAYLRRRDGHSTEVRLVEALCWLAPPVALWGGAVVYENALDQLLITWGALAG